MHITFFGILKKKIVLIILYGICTKGIMHLYKSKPLAMAVADNIINIINIVCT